ncbi:AFG1-like ATPase isoform X2 [Brachypodium distachyon]|uniref:AFG1-like ATPase isoform X2 n=1 Tax=Brachypodium distachyon TaxID=15368 RepID=UPI000D0D4A90|nr:AFG1-like ATPase isoform X2 [Brachypodium distachyon]|eukprot:XP_024313836.1 AFG1-like ATPase isoform X2 [Brachypodium distachyon]
MILSRVLYPPPGSPAASTTPAAPITAGNQGPGEPREAPAGHVPGKRGVRAGQLAQEARAVRDGNGGLPLQTKLSTWDSTREKERRRLLLEEAEDKQHDGVWIDEKRGFIDKLISRKRRGNLEPGVGRWVSYLNREKKLDTLVGQKPVAPVAPKGLYLYGNVGSGKTMLMDMFYGATEGVIKHRRRFHFHEAMLEIHEHMHDVWKTRDDNRSTHSSAFSWISGLPFDAKIKEWLLGEEKYKQETQQKHILLAVADKFLVDRQADKCGASILCFDEIQTIDVFAVVALSGILSRLLSTGTVLVATSNKAPEDLNQDGMQREIFLELLSKLDETCNKILVGTETDYRRLIPTDSSTQIHYFWPITSDSRSMYEAMWHDVTNQAGRNITAVTIPVMFGRSLEIPQSCNGVARFDFEYLCGRPVGAADYIAIARNYHTIFISDIPAMSMKIRDKARRFITLIDEMYNHHCRLICLAVSSIDDLFQGTEEGPLFDLESFQFETEAEGTKLRRDVSAEGNVGVGPSTTGLVSMLSGQEEMFAFRRAISRLIEMQTPLYLDRVPHFHTSVLHQQQGAPVFAKDKTISQSAPV